MRSTTTWGLRLGLAIVAVLVTSLLMEIGLRLLPETVLGYRVEGGRYQRPTEFVRDRRLNSLGYHDIEPTKARPGAMRILLLGDSYVEASSVALHQTVGRQLETYLNTDVPYSHHVVSFGKSGWGQADQYKALERFGPRLKPDIVMTVFLSLNDIRNNSADLTKRHWAHDRRLLTRRPGWSRLKLDEAPWLFVKRSELNRFLSYRLALLGARSRDLASPDSLASIPFDYLVYRTEYDQAWENAWRRTSEILEQTRAFAKARNADHYVVSASTPHGVKGREKGITWLTRAYPAMADYDWDLDRPDRRLGRICRQLGTPLLLLEPRFREETKRSHTPLHWPIDGHWNVEGNRLAGQVIAEFVRQQE